MNTWLPNPNGAVTSLAWSGSSSASQLIVGGAFTTIDSRPNTATPFTTLVRHRLAKINIAGVTSTTLPVVDGTWDPNAGLYVAGPAAAVAEETAGAWLADLLRLPRVKSFAFVTGTQMAHATALAAAWARRLYVDSVYTAELSHRGLRWRLTLDGRRVIESQQHMVDVV